MKPIDETSLDSVAAAEELAQELMRRLELIGGGRMQDDISHGQYKIVSVIHNQGPISVGNLGKYVGLAQSTTSEVIARLKKTGVVTKVKGPNDGRVVMVELTELGRDLWQRRKQLVRHSYRNLFSKLTEAEQVRFTQSLRQLNEILDQTQEP